MFGPVEPAAVLWVSALRPVPVREGLSGHQYTTSPRISKGKPLDLEFGSDLFFLASLRSFAGDIYARLEKKVESRK